MNVQYQMQQRLQGTPVALQPTPISRDMAKEVIIQSVQQFALLRMSQDLVEELMAMRPFGKDFRYDMLAMQDYYNRIRKKLNRNMEKWTLTVFEATTGDIVDSCEPYLLQAMSIMRSALLNKIDSDNIEIAIRISIIFGLLDCLQAVHKALTKKTNYMYTEMRKIMSEVDHKLSFELINGKEPDWLKCTNTVINLFKHMRDVVTIYVDEGVIKCR